MEITKKIFAEIIVLLFFWEQLLWLSMFLRMMVLIFLKLV